MRSASPLRAVVAVGVLAMLTAVAAGSAATKAVVHVRPTGLGRVVVAANGHTLYLFEKDRNGKSACSGSCAAFWPPLLVSGKPHGAGGVKASLLGTTRRADGRLQVTYRRHPLYRFSLDKKAGDTKGEGLDDFGAHWYAVSPAGSKVVPASSGSSGGGSGGSPGYPGYGP